ncbi:MAG: VOC family protein [Chloroflexi bacterium]|nr:VOC family protein [Chloroflexota bacterium]
MPIQRVGHVVLKVRDLDKARRFYCDFLGMTIGNSSERGLFLRFNDYHHDIAIFKVGDDAEPPKDNQVGLVHVALVTDGVDTVRQFYDRAKAMNVEITGWTSHAITNSLYVKDPEGNTIEIYADVPVEEYDWHAQGMGFISRAFDIQAVPARASADAR